MGACNILLSSAGRRVALLEGFRADLASLRIPGKVLAADMDPLTAAGQRSGLYLQLPPLADPAFEETLVELCGTYGISLIVPTIDTELEQYADISAQLAESGTLVLVSGSETVRICSDKRRTWRWLRRNAFPAVAQWDLVDAQESANDLIYPVVAKPSRGSASIGVHRIQQPHELQRMLDLDFVVQQFAPGDEYTVDVWVDRQGRARCAVPRRRIEVRAGEVSKGVTDARDNLIATATAVGEALPGAFGPVTIQLFLSSEGDVNIIEINPRFGGGYPLSWVAGARYPRWAIQDALGLPYDPSSFHWRDGLVMLRYDDAVFVDRSQVGL